MTNELMNMNPFKIISKVKSRINEFGTKETFLRALHRLRIVQVVHSLDFYVDNLSKLKKAVLEGPDYSRRLVFQEVVFIELYERSYKNYQYANDIKSFEFIASQFKNGSRLFAAVKNNQIIALTFANEQYGFLSYLNRPVVKLPKGFTYVHGTETSEEYRGQGVGSQLKVYAYQVLSENRKKQFVSAVFLENTSAKKWHVKIQSDYWGRLTYVKCGKSEIVLKDLSAVGSKSGDLFDNEVDSNNLSSETSQEREDSKSKNVIKEVV